MNCHLLKTTALAALALATLAGCERPPVDSEQTGYRGTGMVSITNPRIQAELAAKNALPAPIPLIEGDAPLAKDVYQNVQVLTDLTVNEFIRHMTAQSNWIAPKEQCVYCHNLENFASDEKYQKVVARRMIQMTRDINVNWKSHVQETGVTCYTCHRGKHIPDAVWFVNTEPTLRGAMASTQGQNKPAAVVNLSSLPSDPFTRYLLNDNAARVVSKTALPTGNPADIKTTEHTYGMMIHVSQALGVNCTHCHNSRSFLEWPESNPARAVAWYAIQMSRGLNQTYMVPLTDVFPANRRGPTGDVAKVNCTTCHQGQPKPLNGVSMLPNHPELARSNPPPAAPVDLGEATVSATADDVAAAAAARDLAAATAMRTGGA